MRPNNISYCHHEFPVLDVPGVAMEGREGWRRKAQALREE